MVKGDEREYSKGYRSKNASNPSRVGEEERRRKRGGGRDGGGDEKKE
jgi:hypothetical protein